MKKLLFLGAALLVLGLAKPSMAQDENAWSVYGGYYFVHSNVSVGEGTTTTVAAAQVSCCSSQSLDFNGGGGQLAYNFNQDSKLKFGVLADFAGYHDGDFGGLNMFTYLFGPRISYGDGKLLPFAQVLFGGARLSGSGSSENAFALTVGGGLDYQITRHWFARPVQAEYLLTEFNGLGSGHQNSFRFSAGVGYRWP